MNTIRLRRSSVANKVPTVSDVSPGELALNTTDQALYFGATDKVRRVLTDLDKFVLSVTDFGAKPDAVTLKDARIAYASNVLNSASATFTSSDVGKSIKVYDADNWIYGVRTTIVSILSSNSVLLSATSPVDMLSGTILATYGTDNSTAIANCLSHASTLVNVLDTGSVNYPIGAGFVTVLFPTVFDGSQYLINSQIVVPRNVQINCEAMIYNNVGNGGTDITYPIHVNAGGHIDTLVLNAAHGCGVSIGAVGDNSHTHFNTLRIWSVGTDINQNGLNVQGYDFSFDNVWIKGGNVGINFDQASDVITGTAYVLGTTNACVKINGCQNITFNKLVFDTNSGAGVKIDFAHHIEADVMAFNNSDASSQMVMTNGLQIGDVGAVSNLNICYQAVQTGGTGLKVSKAKDCVFSLILSDASLFTNVNGIVAFTSAVNYGTLNSGYLNVDVITHGYVTPYSGVKYGILNIGSETAQYYGENVGFNTSSFGGAVGAIAVGNVTTNPNTNPVGGYVQYSVGGIPIFKFSDGTEVSLGTMFNNLNAATSDIATLYGQVGTVGSNLSTLTTTVNVNTLNIATLNSDLGTITTDVAALSSNYSTLNTQVSNIVSDISTLYSSKLNIAGGTMTGDLIVPNLGLNTTDLGSGIGVVGLSNCSVIPTTNPTNGIVMYVTGGVPYMRLSDGSLVNMSADVTSFVNLTTTAAGQSIHSFDSTLFRSAVYNMQITSGAFHQTCTISVVHNGTNVSILETSVLTVGGLLLATFDASITSNVLTLAATPVNASTIFRFFCTRIRT